MIWLIDVLKEKMAALPKALWYFVSFLIVTVLCFAAMNLGLDYEHHAVLIGYFYYIFHDRQALAIPFSYLSIFKEPWALLGFGLTLTYNGKRGKQNKWFNYLFYPVHLLILGIIRMCLKIWIWNIFAYNIEPIDYNSRNLRIIFLQSLMYNVYSPSSMLYRISVRYKL